jgi:hypothetical protein
MDWLNDAPGTVVFWEQLDRVLPVERPESGWARRRLEQLATRAREYLGMVFHRFLEGTAERATPLTITVNGEKAVPWNPFAPFEDYRLELPVQLFEVDADGSRGSVTLSPYVLPPRNLFSSPEEFERLSGPMKWNRQQGLYIYRANRLIQHGGWCGIRAADEHTKLARAALDFQTDLDPVFRINVAKMRVLLPFEIRALVERPINELCHRADAVYRREGRRSSESQRQPRAAQDGQLEWSDIGVVLITAAIDAGESAAFTRIIERLRTLAPETAESLGW